MQTPQIMRENGRGGSHKALFGVNPAPGRTCPLPFLSQFAWRNPPLTCPKPARTARLAAGAGSAARNAHCNALESPIPARLCPSECCPARSIRRARTLPATARANSVKLFDPAGNDAKTTPPAILDAAPAAPAPACRRAAGHTSRARPKRKRAEKISTRSLDPPPAARVNVTQAAPTFSLAVKNPILVPPFPRAAAVRCPTPRSVAAN